MFSHLPHPIKIPILHGPAIPCQCSRNIASVRFSFAKILSGLNAFEINNLQEQETESRYPGDPMLHGAVKLLTGVFADHTADGWGVCLSS